MGFLFISIRIKAASGTILPTQLMGFNVGLRTRPAIRIRPAF
jgi:hypothetical protein